METLRDKSKRLLKQTQEDTDEAIQNFIKNTSYSCVKDFKEGKQTIIDVHSLEMSDAILRINARLERLVSDPSIRPNIRKELLDIISTLI